MTKPENPPAFPLAWIERNAHGVEFPMVQPGATLRDYFAGQALAAMGYIAATPSGEAGKATAAYRIADAMLAERAK